ncbi:alpha/beta hydrolase [Gordonia rhizosphera]|uniref:Putative esterase n=1 Tax=Gordonia rhizosphera NBRC 16068 TaxID=1108045 RepID=K6WBG6_9ACTN|nr:alpha/beta hydrolase [Gordonia rhizosphera]GAB89542.1 putative esterase [Gordonia rhizosphera NBRC 16068]
MGSNATTFRSRHLVDPEIAAPLEVYPPFEFTVESLPTIRERLRQSMSARPSAAELFPDVIVTERRIAGSPGGPDVRVLQYEPREAVGPAAGMVWMHAGGFILGSADDDDATCAQIASVTGTVVVSVDYRLAPETAYPGALDDCYTVLTWMHREAASLGIDPERIGVGGSSAGGGLAASLSVLARDRGEHPVAFQALVYPMLDDRTATATDPNPYAGEFIWTPDDNRFGWQSYLGDALGSPDVPAYAAAARVESAEGLPPTYLCVGSIDLFVDEDIIYASRLIRDGVPVELHVYPGGYHGYTMVPGAQISRSHLRDLHAALQRGLTCRPA